MRVYFIKLLELIAVILVCLGVQQVLELII